jgi:hypothetical protein
MKQTEDSKSDLVAPVWLDSVRFGCSCLTWFSPIWLLLSDLIQIQLVHYQSRQFILSSKALSWHKIKHNLFFTRFLTSESRNELIHLLVCHWPSKELLSGYWLTVWKCLALNRGSIFCWVSVVETEGSKSDLVAPVWLDSDSTGPLSVSDKLSTGLFSLVCANCLNWYIY